MNYISNSASRGYELFSRTKNIVSETLSSDPTLAYFLGFSLGIALTPLNTLVHEWGHKFTAELLWDGAEAEIALMNFGFSGGYCIVSNLKKLSSVGQLFGEKGSVALWSGGRLTAEFLINSVAYISRSKAAASIALPTSLNTAFYALSYFIKDCITIQGAHDFCNMREGGGIYLLFQQPDLQS
ncbi:MAG: hypothetical protein WAM28_01315 [Chlamydiales bacterium]